MKEIDCFEVDISDIGRLSVLRRGRINPDFFSTYGNGKEIKVGISVFSQFKTERFLMSLEGFKIMHFDRIMTAFHEFRRIPTSKNDDTIKEALVIADQKPSFSDDLKIMKPEDLKNVLLAYVSGSFNNNSWITAKLAKAFGIQQSGEREI